MERVCVHVVITGRVQGVNFRMSTREQARAQNVSGWVRNLPDGSVEAVFEGERAAVQQLVSWCHRGPTYARVEHVQAEWQQPEGNEEGFRVI